MTVKPIDMQINIVQLPEVGRNEQARSDTLIGQQQTLDEEANEKSKLKNSKLDESKKGEKTSISEEDKKKDRRNASEHGKSNEEASQKKKEPLKDERMGHFIDVFK